MYRSQSWQFLWSSGLTSKQLWWCCALRRSLPEKEHHQKLLHWCFFFFSPLFSFSHLSNTLSFPLNPPLSEGGMAASCLFVQLADWIETPGKISEIQRQCTELNRAESQIRTEESWKERGSDAGFMLLVMCNKATTQQPCCLCFPKATRGESTSEAFYHSDLVSSAVWCMWDIALETNWCKRCQTVKC